MFCLTHLTACHQLAEDRIYAKSDQELLLDIYREISSMREFEEQLQEETDAAVLTELVDFPQQDVSSKR